MFFYFLFIVLGEDEVVKMEGWRIFRCLSLILLVKIIGRWRKGLFGVELDRGIF